MPIKKCQINNNPGYKWGDAGKCYDYEPGNEESIKEAKKKAITQGVAIGDLEAIMTQVKVVTNTFNFAGTKISFDFDNVLNTKNGQSLYKRTFGERYVITARSRTMTNMNVVWSITDKLYIPRNRVIFTGSNNAKVEKIKELDITTHYDDNRSVIEQLPGVGKLFIG